MSEEETEIEKKEKFMKSINDRITTSFSITFIPVKEFRRFKKLAEDEFRDNYAMTLKFLMDSWEKNQFYLEQINLLWKEIHTLKEEKIKLKEMKPKTFGEN